MLYSNSSYLHSLTYIAALVVCAWCVCFIDLQSYSGSEQPSREMFLRRHTTRWFAIILKCESGLTKARLIVTRESNQAARWSRSTTPTTSQILQIKKPGIQDCHARTWSIYNFHNAQARLQLNVSEVILSVIYLKLRFQKMLHRGLYFV